MQIPDIDIFTWLMNNFQKASYVMCFSNSFDLQFNEFQRYTDFSIPNDLIVSYNNMDFALQLKKILASNYNCSINNVVLTAGGTESNYLVFNSMLSKNLQPS